MLEQNVVYFSEDVEYEHNTTSASNHTIGQVSENENIKVSFLNYIFCSDSYLLEINKKYLDHDYFTDIITFESSEGKGIVSGDIFISVDRAVENAKEFKVTLEEEILRLIIHGLLHLVGYKDGTDDEKLIMRKKEDYYLSLCPKDK